jgi:hypothetical protein
MTCLVDVAFSVCASPSIHILYSADCALALDTVLMLIRFLHFCYCLNVTGRSCYHRVHSEQLLQALPPVQTSIHRESDHSVCATQSTWH